MRILLVGENFRGAALELIYNNLLSLGVDAEVFNTHDGFKISFINRALNKFLKTPYYFGSGVKKINKIVLDKALSGEFDFIFFVKPIFIYPKTIGKIKKYAKIVGFSSDHVGYTKVNSRYFYQSLPFFDLYFVSIRNIENKMYELGAKKVYFLPFNADTACHKIVDATRKDNDKKLGADIIFLGTFAKGENRVKYLEDLCKEGYDVKIYGNGWNNLYKKSCLRNKNKIILGNTPCEEMAKVIGSSKIILAFMRDAIGETTACRTFEIPLCGGFMLHQRTKEAENLLEPDKEAVFFDDYNEMKNKIDFYLQNQELREKIAKAGNKKILNCGELIGDQIKKIVSILEN